MSYERQYDIWRFLYPPRPESRITPAQFAFYKKRGYISQLKMNGECVVIGLGPDRTEVWNRHNEPLKRWSISPEVDKAIRHFFAPDSWTVIVAELLNAKVKDGIRDTLFIHDTLVHNGLYLVGIPYETRLAIVQRMLSKYHPKIIIADASEDPDTLFSMAKQKSEIEGIVMKDPKAELNLCLKEDSNSNHMVKCRVAHKNYAF